MGLRKREIDGLVDEIVDFAEIGEFIDAPLQNYSSGMWVRLGYAIAASLKPDILLADEVLAVGDVSFQRKCIRHMLKYLSDGGTLVFVSHNLYQVQTVCSRSIVLERGRVVFEGTATDGVKHYFECSHPTRNERLSAPTSQRGRSALKRLASNHSKEMPSTPRRRFDWRSTTTPQARWSVRAGASPSGPPT